MTETPSEEDTEADEARWRNQPQPEGRSQNRGHEEPEDGDPDGGQLSR